MTTEFVTIHLESKIYDHPIVGRACRHPDHGIVFIVSGSREVNGRLSNFWHFKPVLADGTLGEELTGYGW